MKKWLSCLLATILSCFVIPTLIASEASSASFIEIRTITPPDLSETKLGKKITCHRPMRQGTPKMTVEETNNKLIAHNYGHGGSGWTLGPGAAKYVVTLLDEKAKARNFNYDTPINIVGAGALGLFSALELLEKGYRNITIIADSFDNLTSHNAGGLLAPVSMDNDPTMQKLVNKIGIDAYIYYKNIAEGGNSQIPKGAIIVPTYFENREDSGLEPYVGQVMRPAKDVILDFQNGTTRKMVAYDDGIFMDTSSLMTSLKAALANRVTYKKERVKSFSALSAPIIVNCTGMGAKALANDPNMISVQGHLVMLKDQNPMDLQHMILVYFGEAATKTGFKVKRSLYMFPKKLPGSGALDVGVIGGTFIEGADENSLNPEEFDIMLKGAKAFYGLKQVES